MLILQNKLEIWNTLWQCVGRTPCCNICWLVECLIGGNGVASRLFWQFFHARWKILFLCGVQSGFNPVRWDWMNLRKNMEGRVPHSSQMGVTRLGRPDGGQQGVELDGGGVEPDESEGQMAWAGVRVTVGVGTPIWYHSPLSGTPSPYLIPHPPYLVLHLMGGGGGWPPH